MKNITIKTLLLGFICFTSCTQDFEVLNENEPNFLKVYANGDDVKNVAGSLFNTFYGPNNFTTTMMFATAADNLSCSYGNFGMRDMSWEPRNSWNNTVGYPWESSTSYTFNQMYAVINTASLVLKAMDNGLEIGEDGVDNDLLRAFARFNMGISYGTLALTFDKTFIVDENITLENASVADAKTYSEVAAQAILYLDEAIELSDKSFTIPADWMGTAGDMPSSELKKYANSWAARILSNLPRNSTELAAVNWQDVKRYADAGVTSDFNVVLDGFTRWYHYAGYYLTYPGWSVLDMYVVNKLDPTMPAHWEDNVNFPTPPESTNPNADKRIETDFAHVPSNNLPAERGYYHWSNYRYKRRDAVFAIGAGTGAMPELMLAENDMYKAEAAAYTGDLSGAAAIINAGTRTTRGQLPIVAANLPDIKEAIHHERIIEMILTGCGLQFFEMRKRDLLQKGTALHFPLPAKILETLGESKPFYTFGGPEGQDGINGSNGGWR
jgi:hypothetical protein